jgi:hypothetical protein
MRSAFLLFDVVIVDLLDSSGGFEMISVKIATEVLVELHKEKHILLYKETVLKEETKLS